MRKDIFAIPIFEDKVDLDKINLPEVETVESKVLKKQL